MHSVTQKQIRSYNDPDPDLSWQRAFEACRKQGSALTASINGERWTLHPTGKAFKCGIQHRLGWHRHDPVSD